MEQYDQRLWNKYDWWRHLEEMKNAFGRKVLVGDERLLGGGNTTHDEYDDHHHHHHA